jgi:uncharacterized protein YjiS (DUF1127 family)
VIASPPSRSGGGGIGGAARSPSVNVAMHKMRCCHATTSLPNRIGRAYFRVVIEIEEIETTRKARTSTNMNLIRNYRNWRRYRETVSELSRLSNRELNDLGISRGDIPFVARKSI